MTGTAVADIDFNSFCDIMGSFATGVSVLTTVDDAEQPCGMTCSAICSVSAEPPLLLTCVRTPSSTLDAISASGRFVANFLDAGGRELSTVFASRSTEKFAQVSWRPSAVLGLPLLEPTVAYAECALHEVVSAGDHVVVLGRVVGGAVRPERFPLGYWRGSYVGVFRVTPPREARRK